MENEREVDFFTELMFGRSYVEKIEDEEKNEEIMKSGENDPHDKNLTELFLPPFIKEMPIGKVLENIDYDELFKQMDTLIKTTNELKPYIKKLKPYIDAFLEKNKG